jgi:hypothetical protein
VQDPITSYYWSGDAIRSRLVSDLVLTGAVEAPAPPHRLMADWQRDIELQLRLQQGDVEALPLARARMRWPEYKSCVQSMVDWTGSIGLGDVLAMCDVALMASRGAKYHHDGTQYGGMAFCNLFLSEDQGLDLHFPAIGVRIPLIRGTAVIFDTGQPHAVIPRGAHGFDAADFPAGQDCTQIFLTWELPVEHANVTKALGIDFDVSPSSDMSITEEQIWRNGRRAEVCPNTGRWQ